MIGTFQGSYLCGAVSYEIKSRPKALSHRNCNQCRKSHGAAFARYGSVLRTDLHIIQGAECIRTYRSSESVLRQFCDQCDSSLFWSRSLRFNCYQSSTKRTRSTVNPNLQQCCLFGLRNLRGKRSGI
jgi:hypothetical protein